ncbi:hypothetical protein ACVWZ3_000162 [Bradyrhizobium sp. i1.3.6]
MMSAFSTREGRHRPLKCRGTFMIGTQRKLADTVSSPVSAAHVAEQRDASKLYGLLTGRHPTEVDISDNYDFDRHVLACVLAASAMDGGQLPERAGLTNQELNALLVQYFPSSPFQKVYLARTVRVSGS